MSEIKLSIQNLKDEIKELEKEEKWINESNVFKISTNTAHLLNIGLNEKFKGYGFFPDWLEKKHEQHWKGKNDSKVEITFKLKPINKTKQKKKRK